MDIEKQKAILQNIKAQLDAMEIETSMTDDLQGSGELRILLPVTEEGHTVLTEITFANMGEEFDYMQFYSTVIAQIGTGYAELNSALENWNLRCPVGAYGIYAPERQLYHKYGVIISKKAWAEPVDDLADYAMLLLDIFVTLFEKSLPLAGKLAFGEIDYKTALREGLL